MVRSNNIHSASEVELSNTVLNKSVLKSIRKGTIRKNLDYVESEKVKVTQSCPTLCNPTDHTVPGVLQARILEWVAFCFSRGSSQPRDWTQVSWIAGGFFTNWAIREAPPMTGTGLKNVLVLGRHHWVAGGTSWVLDSVPGRSKEPLSSWYYDLAYFSNKLWLKITKDDLGGSVPFTDVVGMEVRFNLL